MSRKRCSFRRNHCDVTFLCKDDYCMTQRSALFFQLFLYALYKFRSRLKYQLLFSSAPNLVGSGEGGSKVRHVSKVCFESKRRERRATECTGQCNGNTAASTSHSIIYFIFPLSFLPPGVSFSIFVNVSCWSGHSYTQYRLLINYILHQCESIFPASTVITMRKYFLFKQYMTRALH